jgi:hypothetical protein
MAENEKKERKVPEGLKEVDNFRVGNKFARLQQWKSKVEEGKYDLLTLQLSVKLTDKQIEAVKSSGYVQMSLSKDELDLALKHFEKAEAKATA